MVTTRPCCCKLLEKEKRMMSNTMRPNPFLHHARKKREEVQDAEKPVDVPKPSNEKKTRRAQETQSPLTEEGMSHTLLQIRPCPSLLRPIHVSHPVPSCMIQDRRNRKRTSLFRWFFVYLPLVTMTLYLLFTICNVLLKRRAFHMLFDGVQ